jgi:uncharacterized protein (UPF0335 family)
MSDTRLKSIYSRWLRLEEAKQEISDDLKELFKEAKGDGYDGKAIRAAFRKVAKLEGDKAEEIREQDALVDLYIDALTRDAREAGSYAEATGREPTVREIEKVQPQGAEIVTPQPSAKPAPAESMGGTISATIPDDDVPAFIKRDRKPLRPNCLNPGNCAGYGSHTCHSCTVAAREVEPA